MVTWMRRFGLTFCILALAAFATGCGMDQSPMASGVEEEGTALESEGKTYLTLSSGALEPAGKRVKIAKGDEKTVSKLIGRAGGVLVVKMDKVGNEDDLLVKFIVPKKALNEKVKITMAVYGETLDDLVIEFAPAGLVFEKPAKLKIYKRPGVRLGVVEAMHHYEDDSSEVAELKVGEEKSHGVITIKIPGFSRYSMGP